MATEAGQVLARELDAAFVFADLSDPAAARSLFAEVEARLGTVSILVHSASPRRHENQTVLAVTETQWDEMVTVGLAGFHLRPRRLSEHVCISRREFPHRHAPERRGRTPAARTLEGKAQAQAGHLLIELESTRSPNSGGARGMGRWRKIAARTPKPRAILKIEVARRAGCPGVTKPQDAYSSNVPAVRWGHFF
jgi:hypothetical protein